LLSVKLKLMKLKFLILLINPVQPVGKHGRRRLIMTRKEATRIIDNSNARVQRESMSYIERARYMECDGESIYICQAFNLSSKCTYILRAMICKKLNKLQGD
jgi:ABC-type uncharacterized transport system auxiliary subunit